jgi:hypothetical protein
MRCLPEVCTDHAPTLIESGPRLLVFGATLIAVSIHVDGGKLSAPRSRAGRAE